MGNDCRHETKARKFIDFLYDRLNWGIVTFRIKNKHYNDLTLKSDLFGIFLSIFWLKSSQAEELHTKNSTNLLVFYFGIGNSLNNLIVRHAVQPFRQGSGLFFCSGHRLCFIILRQNASLIFANF